MKLLKLTKMTNVGMWKKKWVERDIYVNPLAITTLKQPWNVETTEVGAIIHFGGEKIYVKEKMEDIVAYLQKAKFQISTIDVIK